MTSICITNYNAICNLGDSITEIFDNAIKGNNNFFTKDDTFIKGKNFYYGKINTTLPEINSEKYNLRCNKLILKCLKTMNINTFINKYKKNRIAVIIATTNSGVEEFATTENFAHSEIGNPAEFLRRYLHLKSYAAGISTACSSGIKAFSTARNLIASGFCDAAIVGGTDSLARLSIHGFNSLEVLSHGKSSPFGNNRDGINIGEGAALFTIEKSNSGIKILGIGETSDAYNAATPDPSGIQVQNAIKEALLEADISSNSVDYINLHGTGTISNDLAEANAIFEIFQDNVLCGSTKSQTGHCLGASASIETAICCETIKRNVILKHVYSNEFDPKLPPINLNNKTFSSHIKTCLCNAIGFGGTNAVLLLGE